MQCSTCGSDDIRVMNTIHDPTATFRKRKCNGCGTTFRTIETYMPDRSDFNSRYTAALYVKNGRPTPAYMKKEY